MSCCKICRDDLREMRAYLQDKIAEFAVPGRFDGDFDTILSKAREDAKKCEDDEDRNKVLEEMDERLEEVRDSARKSVLVDLESVHEAQRDYLHAVVTARTCKGDHEASKIQY